MPYVQTMTKKPIRLLPDQLISQIAAGEIIERPASIVKELLENAADAYAKNIDIFLEQGGKTSIRIEDDGDGIPSDQLTLAITRHATSKIQAWQDLSNIHTLGFRGEALASIAAVSTLTLTSRQNDATHGHQVCSTGPNAHTVKPAPCRPSTMIEVTDLYCNTPARRKFLKSDHTEYGYCLDIVKKLALSHASIAFCLSHNKKNVVSYAVGSAEDRIRSVLGSSFLEYALPVDARTDFCQITGFVLSPTAPTTHSQAAFLFINNRLVKDRLLTSAIREAYRDVLHLGKNMAYLLYITIEASLVDVNVHPAKTEVRFQNASLVYHFVLNALKAVLSTTPLEQSNCDLATHTARFTPTPFPRNERAAWTAFLSAGTEPPPPAVVPTPSPPPLATQVATQERPITQTAPQAPLHRDNFPLGFAIAQLHGIYILSQNSRGLVVVDMHAAHERIVYETLKVQCTGTENITQQTLVVPLSFQAAPPHLHAVQEHQNVFVSCGFDITVLADTHVVVRAVPAILADSHIEILVRNMLQDLEECGQTHEEDGTVEHILSKIACHSALRAHRTLSITEMNALLRAAERTIKGGQCNHGRPTYYEISLSELDHLFMRGH